MTWTGVRATYASAASPVSKLTSQSDSKLQPDSEAGKAGFGVT